MFVYILSGKGKDSKINILDNIKLKNFCTIKETINQPKRPPIEWEKITLNDTSKKGLISKIYKELNSTAN